MKGTVHPANRVREQGELWTRRWQTPSTEADLPAYRCLLHNLPQHPQVELDLIPTVQELKGAMGKMKSKAPGADDWQASMFLALPVDWWAGFQRLWAAVVTTVLVPSILAAILDSFAVKAQPCYATSGLVATGLEGRLSGHCQAVEELGRPVE